MKTKTIKLGDGCSLTVTLIDKQGMPLKLSTLKSLVLSIVSDMAQDMPFTANRDNTLTILLTHESNLTKPGMYDIRARGELSDGQSFDYAEHVIEVRELSESTDTTFVTSLVLREVNGIDEKEIPDIFRKLGYAQFIAFEDYEIENVVIFGNSLYKFTANHTAGIWNADNVEETSFAELIGQCGTSFEDLGYSPFSETETYAAGDVVIYDGSLYKFTAEHSAGAWIGTDADATSVEELMKEKADAIKVLTREAQNLTAAEKAQVLENIGAIGEDDTLMTINGTGVKKGDAVTTAETAIVVDGEMSDSSTNAVQNKVVKSYVDGNGNANELETKLYGTFVETEGEDVKDDTLQILALLQRTDPAYDYKGTGTVKVNYLNLTELKSQGLNKFKITAHSTRSSNFVFTKEKLPNEDVNFETLLSDYLCDSEATIDNYITSISANTTVTVDVPDGAKYLYFNYTTGSGNSSKPQAIIPILNVKVSSGDLDEIPVNFSNVTFKKTIPNSKNVLNPNEIVDNSAVKYTTGSTTYASGNKSTGYIPVSKRGLICNHVSVGPGSIQMGYAVYDSNKTYIRGMAAPNDHYEYQDGDAYIRFSLNGNYQLFQVEEGNIITDYVPYSEKEVIDDYYLPKFEIDNTQMNFLLGELAARKMFGNPLDMLLPSKFYYVKGDTLQLFYKGFVKAINLENRFVKPSCSIGTHYKRYFEIPSGESATAGNYNLAFNIYDDNRNVLGNGSTQVRVVNSPISPSSAKYILCVGSSTTEGGQWVNEAYRRLCGTDGTGIHQGKGLTNIVFTGHMSKQGTVPHYYGKSGWGWKDFATDNRSSAAFRFYLSGDTSALVLNIGDVYTNNNHSYTIAEINEIDDVLTIRCTTSSSSDTPLQQGVLTISEGSGTNTLTYSSVTQDTSNLFWNNDKVGGAGLDFKNYFDTYCSGVSPDLVYVVLAANRLFSDSPETIKGYIESFATQLHSDYPNCKLIIVAPPIPSMRLMMPGYGASGDYSDTYNVLCKEFEVFKKYKEVSEDERFSDFVEFEQWSAQFDSDYGFVLSEKNANTRYSDVKEEYSGNTLHPSNSVGYMQQADAAYRSIVAHICQ